MPSASPDALEALERLYRRHVVTLEQAQAAARLITGDPAAVFPPPKAPPAQETTAPPASSGDSGTPQGF